MHGILTKLSFFDILHSTEKDEKHAKNNFCTFRSLIPHFLMCLYEKIFGDIQ